jgi:hypothetical protein
MFADCAYRALATIAPQRSQLRERPPVHLHTRSADDRLTVCAPEGRSVDILDQPQRHHKEAMQSLGGW